MFDNIRGFAQYFYRNYREAVSAVLTNIATVIITILPAAFFFLVLVEGVHFSKTVDGYVTVSVTFWLEEYLALVGVAISAVISVVLPVLAGWNFFRTVLILISLVRYAFILYTSSGIDEWSEVDEERRN